MQKPMRRNYDDYFRNAKSMLESDHGKEKTKLAIPVIFYAPKRLL